MATKAKDSKALSESEDRIAEYQGQLDTIEQALRDVLKEQSPGFSERFSTLLEQANVARLKLQGAVSDQVQREAARAEFDQLAEKYAALRRRQDKLAFVTNRGLLIAATIVAHEADLMTKADETWEKLATFVGRFDKEDKAMYHELRWLRSQLDDKVNAELEAPATREEVFGEGVTSIPLDVEHAMLRLNEIFRRAHQRETVGKE